MKPRIELLPLRMAAYVQAIRSLALLWSEGRLPRRTRYPSPRVEAVVRRVAQRVGYVAGFGRI